MRMNDWFMTQVRTKWFFGLTQEQLLDNMEFLNHRPTMFRGDVMEFRYFKTMDEIWDYTEKNSIHHFSTCEGILHEGERKIAMYWIERAER